MLGPLLQASYETTRACSDMLMHTRPLVSDLARSDLLDVEASFKLRLEAVSQPHFRKCFREGFSCATYLFNGTCFRSVHGITRRLITGLQHVENNGYWFLRERNNKPRAARCNVMAGWTKIRIHIE
jgi:hypothetical protein